MIKALVLLMVMTATPTISWQPHPGPQTEALRRIEFEVLLGGARGGGKTEAGLAWMIELRYLENPRYRGLVIRRNADDLSDWIGRARVFYRPCKAQFAGKVPIITFPSGATIKCGHLKDEGAYTKYVGHEYQKILIEELTLIPYENDYEKLIMSCRTTVRGLSAQVLSTTNPGNAGHVWVKGRFVDLARNKTYIDPDSGEGRIFIPSTIYDNPTLREIDPTYERRLKAIKDEKLRNAWLYGDWDKFTGQFFNKWNPHKHVIKPFNIPPQWFRYRGFDWGYSPGHSAVGWWAIDYEGNHYKYREFYERENTPTMLAKKINQLTSPDENIIATLASPDIFGKRVFKHGKDTDSMEFIADILIRNGFYIKRANNDRINGWNKMRDMMEWDANLEPRMFIFDTCPHTIRTFPGLVHDDHNVEDMKKGGEDHIAECDRYVFMHTVSSTAPILPKTEQQVFIDSITTPQTVGNYDWERL